MKSTVTLEFERGPLHFSSGHFTIFSATKREHLHGHNYYVCCRLTTQMTEPGITFDYNLLKKKLMGYCEQLDRKFLLPTRSPYLTLEQQEDYTYAIFNQQRIPFLNEDIYLLPLSNITLEELSAWFIQQLQQENDFMSRYCVSECQIKVYNGLEQCAIASWHS